MLQILIGQRQPQLTWELTWELGWELSWAGLSPCSPSPILYGLFFCFVSFTCIPISSLPTWKVSVCVCCIWWPELFVYRNSNNRNEWLIWFCFVVKTGDALNALKSSLNDPNNVLQSWDPTLVNPCTWLHVTCNSENSVTRVYALPNSSPFCEPLICMEK